jgi:hypothetical protein
MSSSRPFRIDVLVLPVQLVDFSPIDLFGMCTKACLLVCQLPEPVTSLGVLTEINFISEAGAGLLRNAQRILAYATVMALDDKVSALGVPRPDHLLTHCSRNSPSAQASSLSSLDEPIVSSSSHSAYHIFEK